MTTIKPPEDSLSSYFDDLLSGEEDLELQVSPASTPVAANIVVLPTKNMTKIADEKYTAAASLTQVNAKSAVTSGGKPSAYNTTENEKHLEPKTRHLQPPKHERQPFAEPDHVQTLEQKQKLEKLLQTARTQLLMTAPVEVKTEPQLDTQPQTRTAFKPDPNEIQDWVIETTTAIAESEETVSVSCDHIVAEPTMAEEKTAVTEVETYHLEGVEWMENGRPQWAQARFDVLLFQVSGLTLAVPLISLGQIQPITEELTPLFGQADWFMGFQLTSRGKISTVNTAKFVMPERYDENFVKTAKYVVSIDGVPWGLAVDSVNQPITLYPEDVKWRTDRTKRPWLAGTVKDHMCVLLDIPRIGQMLIQADKNFGRSRP